MLIIPFFLKSRENAYYSPLSVFLLRGRLMSNFSAEGLSYALPSLASLNFPPKPPEMFLIMEKSTYPRTGAETCCVTPVKVSKRTFTLTQLHYIFAAV